MVASEVLERVEVDKRSTHYLIKGITSKQKMSETLKDILKLIEYAERAGEETAIIRIERLGEVVILQVPKEVCNKQDRRQLPEWTSEPIWW